MFIFEEELAEDGFELPTLPSPQYWDCRSVHCAQA